MRPAPLLLAGLLACLQTALSAQAQQRDPHDPYWAAAGEARDPSPADRERVARRQLEAGRALREEGRLELAEAALRRGLAFAPEHAGLYRELARTLGAAGDAEAAADARARADALAPPPPPLPDSALPLPSQGLLVVLIPPSGGSPERRPRGWPEGEVARTLEERVARRLPQAEVLHADFDSVKAARRWLLRRGPRVVLSLRVDRVYCGDTIKDGRFSLAWLRAALEASVFSTRSMLEDPTPPETCRAQATARALEETLTAPLLAQRLAADAPSSAQRWPTLAIRALFPGLSERIDTQLEAGAQLLARGRIQDAADAFRVALQVDPEDPAARTYLHEAEATLALSGELAARRRSRRPQSEQDAGTLDPRFSDAQRAALESQLVEERRRRDELLAVLAVMDEDAALPPANLLATLQPVPIRDPDAFGPTLARRRAGGAIEARGARAPDGSEIARYYFPDGDELPVLREEDLTQDGRADRWIAYAGSHRAEIWEAGRNAGRPDVRLVFSQQGRRLARIEIDRDGNGRPEQVLHYSGDRLTTEARDTSGNGVLDTFDRLDAEGRVVLREEDTNGDGEIDVRSVYEAGRLVRRELTHAADG